MLLFLTLLNRPFKCLLITSLVLAELVFTSNGQLYAHNLYNLGDNIIRHIHQGELLMNRKRYEEAAEEFRIALSFNQYSSMSAGIYNNIGLCYQQLKDWPMAMVSFQRAIRMQPNFALYYQNLIETYVKSGATETAVAQLQYVTELNPIDAEAWYLLGLLYSKRGETDQSVSCLKRYVALRPNAPLAKKLKQSLPKS